MAGETRHTPSRQTGGGGRSIAPPDKGQVTAGQNCSAQPTPAAETPQSEEPVKGKAAVRLRGRARPTP